MSGRTQRVKINGILSEPFATDTGVPQGSYSGPLLFLAFINDIVETVKFYNLLMFADDIKFYKTILQPSDCSKLNRDLSKILEWSKINFLPINDKKTQVFRVSRARNMLIFDYRLGSGYFFGGLIQESWNFVQF